MKMKKFTKRKKLINQIYLKIKLFSEQIYLPTKNQKLYKIKKNKMKKLKLKIRMN